MYKIAVMGAYDSIYGFASLGLDIHPVSDIRGGEETLRRLATGEYAVIYITEELAAQIPQEIDSQIPGAGSPGNHPDTRRGWKYRRRYRRSEKVGRTGSRF